MLHLNRKGLIPASIAGALIAFALLCCLAFASPARADESAIPQISGDTHRASHTIAPPYPREVTLHWSDGKEVSFKMIVFRNSRNALQLTFDFDSVKGTYTSRHAMMEADYSKGVQPMYLVFERNGFGAMEVSWRTRYKGPKSEFYVERRPNPPAVEQAQPSGNIDLAWSDGEAISVPVKVSYGNPALKGSKSDIVHGTDTTVGDLVKSNRHHPTRMSLQFSRPGYSPMVLHWYYDDNAGIYYRVETLPAEANFQIARSDGESISASVSHDGTKLVLDEAGMSHGSSTTAQIVKAGTAFDYVIFQRDGFGDILWDCDWSQLEGVACESSVNPDPTEAPGTDIPPTEKYVSVDWGDGEMVSLNVSRSGADGMTYSDLTHGSSTTYTAPPAAYQAVHPNASYLAFQRPGHGYLTVSWYYDNEYGITTKPPSRRPASP